jgi:hypothetical protein
VKNPKTFDFPLGRGFRQPDAISRNRRFIDLLNWSAFSSRACLMSDVALPKETNRTAEQRNPRATLYQILKLAMSWRT